MSSPLLKYFSYIIVLSLSFVAYAQESDSEFVIEQLPEIVEDEFMYAYGTTQQEELGEEEDEQILEEKFIAGQSIGEDQELLLEHFLSEFQDVIQISTVVITLEQQGIKNREFKKIAKQYIAEQPLQDESVGIEFLKLYAKNHAFRERFHTMQTLLVFNNQQPQVSQEEVSLSSEASLSEAEYLGLYAKDASFKELVDKFQLFVLLQTNDNKGLLEQTLDLASTVEASYSSWFFIAVIEALWSL